MYVLFEEHQYESHAVEEVLKDIYVLQDVNKKVSVQYVGYYYSPHMKDCVFILPKVLLTEKGTLVGMQAENGEAVTPEMVLEPKGQERLSEENRKFIYEFSVWIYRALSVFYRANPRSEVILYRHLPQAGGGRRHKANTYLDIVLSLIRFNQENQDFVMFAIKNLHRGNNKINWTRTICKEQAYVQGKDVVYLHTVNRKRVVNYEEELFVIFFSILNYLNNEYGFRTPINVQYDLIRGKEMEQYLRGKGKTRLRQIRYKYFSDKALQLWDLCYAFFENSHQLAINAHAQEYMLAKSFNVVFEAMVDELIGTPHERIPKGLANQDDGKRVDHLYKDLALTSAEGIRGREVYYIGDSKYYRSGAAVAPESIYKQYTYARNVIQWNVNLFLDNAQADAKERERRETDKAGEFGSIRLQDKQLTEGYDVIPNFFIRAFVNGDRLYDDGKNNIRKHTNGGEHCTTVSYQFEDRLFDRDTLFLSHYDVNFLYVLFLYGRNRADEKGYWRHHVRRVFREEIREVVQREFEIYAMRARVGVDGEVYVQRHFYELNGRVFQPYGEERKMYFAYARPVRKRDETEEQLEELRRSFVIAKCSMGADPERVLEGEWKRELERPVSAPQWLTLHYLERYRDEGMLVGYYRGEDHLRWIMGGNDRGTLVYGVRLAVRGEDSREGAHTAKFYKDWNVRFVLLYTDGVEESGDCRVFHVKDMAQRVSEERMRRTWYPFEPKGSYFFFRFDEEVSLGRIRMRDLLRDLLKRYLIEGEPMFLKGEELLKYREGF